MLGYSPIKIDHIADSVLKLPIKIGVHLISVELSQLPTLATKQKTRTVGIVEPRVVVKIPWTKIGRKTLPQENYATKQMHSVSPLPAAPDPPNAIKVYQSDDVRNDNLYYTHYVLYAMGFYT